jgi:CheY-like chemotaxis protein/HPt (histidine-containing phosphotransfer) domain-containing protein/anti-sigma regulatory factor (Ser/Thr protein kinase)
LDVSEDLPTKLFGDELRVKQIFNNLLSNAFKYTREGEVSWEVFLERDEEGLWLVTRIKDTGVGIKEEDIEKLFSDYSQVDAKSNRKIEGTGLGLSITKSLAAMMGGSIAVESEYGKGSTFTVRIRQGDLGSPPLGAAAVTNLQSFNFSASKRLRNEKFVRIRLPYARVLVVDDVVTNLDVVRGILKPYAIKMDCVTSGQETIDLIRAGEPVYDAIFMDHMMPEMDGIEATRIIREEIGSDYAKKIPILALTANAIVGNEELFLNAGFQAFLSKPIDIMAMDAAIRKWVRNKDKEKSWKESAESGASERREGSEDRRKTPDRRKGNDRRGEGRRGDDRRGDDRRGDDGRYDRGGSRGQDEPGIEQRLQIPGLDVRQMLDMLAGDEETYLTILRSYLTNTPDLLDSLDRQMDNLKDYAITVHGVKGGSRNIGATAIGMKAEQLEFAAKAGDATFVQTETASFKTLVEELLLQIASFLEENDRNLQKPMRDAPDPDVLAQLRAASETFDIDGVDAAIDALDSFEYREESTLLTFLREQQAVMGFKQIQERLKEMGI